MFDENFQKRVGKHLQSLRKEAGFKSAKSFADFVGISPSAYTEYEQGRRSFTYETAWAFADALDCTIDEIGGRIPPANKYADERQEALNNQFESLSDEGKDAALGAVSGIRAAEGARSEDEGVQGNKRTA